MADTSGATVAVLGMGNWGTALARILGISGRKVVGWTVEDEVFRSITDKNVNDKYLPHLPLPNVTATKDIASALPSSVEFIILALPSSVIMSVVRDIIPCLKPHQILVDLAKGLPPHDPSRKLQDVCISNVIEAELAAASLSNPVVAVTGPTIAAEVARGVLTTALAAHPDMTAAQRVATALTTSTFVIEATTDHIGPQLWGAFKNTVALACGVVDGLREAPPRVAAAAGDVSLAGITASPTTVAVGFGPLGGDNLKAAVVSRGFQEGCRLLRQLGASDATAAGPAGLGDLFVTSTSPASRNRSLGQMLATGRPLSECLQQMSQVAEGVPACQQFRAYARARDIAVPFLDALHGLLAGEIAPAAAVKLMVSPARAAVASIPSQPMVGHIAV
eukprot:TRINITY_DN8314_c0_g1_i1.p1 TRINITY_DN8314_c0_g1~~TRINITY_DN8314_c0_g1_i1.p1  ORF type:complete len:391 (+),score=47.75 TRINITY_DN8314_c0_g1_i1:103-1275(+)